MDGEKRKRGRPPMPPEDRRGPNITFRTPGGLRTRLIGAAQLSGRAMSEEVVARLEQSFMERDILTRVFGGEDVILFAQLVAGEVQVAQALTNRSWREDRATRELIQSLVNQKLKAILDAPVAVAQAKKAHEQMVRRMEDAWQKPEGEPAQEPAHG